MLLLEGRGVIAVVVVAVEVVLNGCGQLVLFQLVLLVQSLAVLVVEGFSLTVLVNLVVVRVVQSLGGQLLMGEVVSLDVLVFILVLAFLLNIIVIFTFILLVLRVLLILDVLSRAKNGFVLGELHLLAAVILVLLTHHLRRLCHLLFAERVILVVKVQLLLILLLAQIGEIRRSLGLSILLNLLLPVRLSSILAGGHMTHIIAGSQVGDAALGNPGLRLLNDLAAHIAVS